MAATLSGPAISGAITCTLTNPTSGYATPTAAINHTTAINPVVGSSAGQWGKIYSADFSVTSGTPLVLTLSDGSMTDPLGNALTFASSINAIKATITNTTTGQDLTLFGGTNGLFASSAGAICYAGTTPGSVTLDYGTQGATVDSTHKVVTLTAAAGTVTGKITIAGR